MLTYSQSMGRLTDGDNLLGTGWSGNNSRPGVNPDCLPGKNNPDLQDKVCIGPLPRGTYGIREPIDHPELGPLAFPLDPHPTNEMFGRSGFFIHGASMDPAKRDNSSEGCIIMPRATREALRSYAWKMLEVVE